MSLLLVIFACMAATCAGDFTSSDVSSYVFPPHQMALDDQNYVLTNSVTGADLTARDDRIESDLTIGIHRYNVYWNSFESSGVPSSTEPLDCQAGYYQVPADATGLTTNGGKYSKYRCVDAGLEALFQELLQTDQAQGWESAAIIWCAAVYARDPECLGQPETGAESAPANFSAAYGNFSTTQSSVQARIESITPVLVQPPGAGANSSSGGAAESAFDASGCSCAPADAYLDDYDDYITYLGDRVNSEQGRFSHYIVWNEVRSFAKTEQFRSCRNL